MARQPRRGGPEVRTAQSGTSTPTRAKRTSETVQTDARRPYLAPDPVSASTGGPIRKRKRLPEHTDRWLASYAALYGTALTAKLARTFYDIKFTEPVSASSYIEAIKKYTH